MFYREHLNARLRRRWYFTSLKPINLSVTRWHRTKDVPKAATVCPVVCTVVPRAGCTTGRLAGAESGEDASNAAGSHKVWANEKHELVIKSVQGCNRPLSRKVLLQPRLSAEVSTRNCIHRYFFHRLQRFSIEFSATVLLQQSFS